MNAFFCATPLHVFTSINMKVQLFKNIPSDIYILNHIPGNEIIAEKLMNQNLFENVVLVDNLEFNRRIPKSNFKFIRNIKLIKWLSSYDEISEKYFLLNNKKYDEIFIGVFDIMFKMALKTLLKRNNNIKINLFEDGAGSYKTENFKQKSKAKYIFKVLGYNQTIKFTNIYLYNPILYSGFTNAIISKIPSVSSNNSNLIKIFNEVFGYKVEYSIKEKIIFFEQPLHEIDENLSSKVELILKNIIMINDKIKENYIVKMHPRSISKEYRDLNIFKENFIPWEIIDLNNLSSDSILVSYYSTTCFTSKLIFEKEPFIIFLFNICDVSDIKGVNDDLLKFVDRFQKAYSNPEKIFIPENINELRLILKDIVNDKEF